MKAIARHVSRCLIAGIVALLPIGGTLLGVLYLEDMISESWLDEQAFYVPGMGLVAAVLLVYLIGLLVSTFLGRWIIRLLDKLIHSLPLIGSLYITLKQILGYSEGEGAIFQGVVLVPSREHEAVELGLITLRERGEGAVDRLTVFVPGSPNPTTGRLLVMDADRVTPLDIPVNEALKALVAVGAVPLSADADSAS